MGDDTYRVQEELEKRPSISLPFGPTTGHLSISQGPESADLTELPEDGSLSESARGDVIVIGLHMHILFLGLLFSKF